MSTSNAGKRDPLTADVRPWFGRDERPPTSGVSPVRRAGAFDNGFIFGNM
jgi:hypothetical protein